MERGVDLLQDSQYALIRCHFLKGTRYILQRWSRQEGDVGEMIRRLFCPAARLGVSLNSLEEEGCAQLF
jgi:hypothetical protein